jgi:hypothetical protein
MTSSPAAPLVPLVKLWAYDHLTLYTRQLPLRGEANYGATGEPSLLMPGGTLVDRSQ